MCQRLNKRIALLAIAVLALIAPNAYAQNLLLNPGFESGFTGWTTNGSALSYSYTDYSLTPTAAFGGRLASFNSTGLAPNGVLSQTFATVSGQSYTASFVFGNINVSASPTTQRVVASAINTANAALLGSVTADDTVTGVQNTFGAIMDTTFSFVFTATGTQTTLQFDDQPASTTINSDGLIDNISVVVGTAVVPEAGTLALLLPTLGTMAIGVVLRRR